MTEHHSFRLEIDLQHMVPSCMDFHLENKWKTAFQTHYGSFQVVGNAWGAY